MSDISWHLGSWKCVGMHDLDKFHDALGMPAPMSEAIKQNALSMTCSCALEGDEYVLTMCVAPGAPQHSERYKLGVEFASKDIMGNASVNKITNEDGVIKETVKTEKYIINTTKSLNKGRMIMKVECNGLSDTTSTSEWEKC